MDQTLTSGSTCSTKGCSCGARLRTVAILVLPVLAVVTGVTWWMNRDVQPATNARQALEANQAAIAASMDKYAKPPADGGAKPASPPPATPPVGQ